MADVEHQGERPGGHADLDAMGNDKRRHVVGRQYGATVRKRLLVYGAVVATIVVVIVAFLTVIAAYDDRNVAVEDTAPWASAPTKPPRDVDYKANGPHPDHCPAPCKGDVTIPVTEIFNR